MPGTPSQTHDTARPRVLSVTDTAPADRAAGRSRGGPPQTRSADAHRRRRAQAGSSLMITSSAGQARRIGSALTPSPRVTKAGTGALTQPAA